MGLIKEPKGVDLNIAPRVLTDKDKQLISKVIAEYKRTGRVPSKTTLLRKTARKKGKTAKA
jgi:hypothetical protein